MPVEIINYALAAIMVGVALTWSWLIRSMLATRKKTPRLDDLTKQGVGAHPKVSVILPARNEEAYIGRCLHSLTDQDYPNYEVITIDDSSDDGTAEIISRFAAEDPRVEHVTARPKPDGWMGKNWACMEGYRRADGDLLLFTDSDTWHARNAISMAVAHLHFLNLDALTAIPRLLCLDFWTRVTLPMISTFLHTRFSALRVNDPSKKTGYFFGSFFIIRKKTYREIGTHEGVRREIIEDGALGKKVKEGGYKMKMVLADYMIEAVWARDLQTLWNALKRLMVPLYLTSGKIAIGIFFAVLFLLFMPFAFLAYSAFTLHLDFSSQVLFAASLIASGAIYAGAAIETRILHLNARYALLCPLGGLIVVLGFQAGIIRARDDASVIWRGRHYSLADYSSNPIEI